MDDNKGASVKRIFHFGFLLACLVMLGASPVKRILCRGFLPENHLSIPVGFVGAGISLDQWTSLFNKYETIYSPIISSRGGTLQLNRLWENPTVNASAGQSKSIWTINMYGGLARHPMMTIDAMALVVCHETGHHLGGAPKWYEDPDDWAATEGGADYFSTLKCARRMFADDDNVQIISRLNLNPGILSRCSDQFALANEAAICARITAASLIISELMAMLDADTVVPQLSTPDERVVNETIADDYPTVQCRLDTYFQGALCAADVRLFQGSDYHTASCAAPNFHVGLRPKCWFKPDDGDQPTGSK